MAARPMRVAVRAAMRVRAMIVIVIMVVSVMVMPVVTHAPMCHCPAAGSTWPTKASARRLAAESRADRSSMSTAMASSSASPGT